MKAKLSVGIIDAGPGDIALGIRWMQGTVWTTRCSNYFRAANGRVVTQWPCGARAFWGMTRRFKLADFAFEPASVARPAAYLSRRGGS
jgi:cyclohexanone monooxygenase